MKAIAFLVALILSPIAAFAQSAVSQAGPPAAGHAPMYLNSTGGQVFVQDSGPARGGKAGVGLSELLLAARGTGTPPYAGQGTGPYGANFCDYDGPTTNATGYHYFCMSPNAGGGGLLAFGYAGGASPLPLQFIVNGTTYQFPFLISGILGPPSTTVNDLACWNNTVGTLLKDCGALPNLLATANTWALTQTFSVVPIIPGLPNLTTNVEGTGISGLDVANWFIFQAPATIADAENPALRVQRNPTYTNNIPITGAGGNGTTATFTYSGAAIPLGHTIQITGEQPWGYNGQCVVTASSAGSVSCANTTTGAQTVAGVFYDTIASGYTTPTLWVLDYTTPTGAFYEWPLTVEQFNSTGVALGYGAQNVAINATTTKQYKGSYNYTTAAFVGSISTTTLTVSSITSGSLSTGNILSGGTTITGTYIVNQLTSTEVGGSLGGTGTYTVSASQTASPTTATDQIGPTWGANIVCQDYTSVQNPISSCIGAEIDNYWLTGAGTDTNVQRVVLQLAYGSSTFNSPSTDHAGVGLLFTGEDLSVLDNAILFESPGAIGTILNVSLVDSNIAYIIYGSQFSLDGLGNILTYGTVSIGSVGDFALVVAGGAWFELYSVNQPISSASPPACDSSYVGAHATINNAIAPVSYNTPVTTGGTDVWPIHCARAAGVYNWYYD